MDNTSIQYLHNIKMRSQVIYISILLFVVSAMAASPFIYVEVTVNSNGVIRPVAEKSEIKTLYSGIIDSISCREGEYISRNGPIIYLQSNFKCSKFTSIINDNFFFGNFLIHMFVLQGCDQFINVLIY
jgi:HlyD family secretion protein